MFPLKLDASFLRSSTPRPDEDYVFMLAVEGGPPRSEWTFGERILDVLVKNFQPAPALTHVELFVPPEGKSDETNFATYIGREAGWGSSEPDTDFYVGGRNSWRAFPVRASQLGVRARRACENERGAPYSFGRYLTSTLPLRVFASLLSSSAKAPAHCATLSARVLKAAGVALPRSAAWYSPSTLWLELSRPSRVELMLAAESPRVGATVEAEAALAYVETLLRGSDAAVRAMTDRQCRTAIAALQQRLLAEDDDVVRVVYERQLARGLLRWGEVNRK